LAALANVARWKIRILSEQEKEAGGLYYFDTEQALNDYQSGPIIAQLRNMPVVTDIVAKRFDVIDDLTSFTRGPVLQ
jgi:hypothetical protein